MNVRIQIVWFSLVSVIALWTVPQVVRASQHEEPSVASESSHNAAENPGADTLEEKDGHGEGESSAGSEPAVEGPQYKLGKPLDGYFDINVLRSSQRILGLRYSLDDMVLTVRGANGKLWAVQMGCQIEFGSESGMAEISGVDEDVRKAIQDLVRQYPADVLLKTSGKLRFKDDMARAIDDLLKTASVRRIYLTDFQIIFVS